MDSGGNLPSGGSVWFPTGQTYTVVWAPSNDSDPPASPYRTLNNVSGVNDVSVVNPEWVSGPTPTFVSPTSFTMSQDQTGTFTVGRRIKTTNTAGTVYSTIKTSTFSNPLTTVTVINDGSSALDSGLSAVSYGILSSVNESIPTIVLGNGPLFSDYANRTKTVTGDLSYLPASTNSFFRPTLPYAFIQGFTIANTATTDAMTISPGQCLDSGNAISMYCSSSAYKTQSTFAAGNSTGARMSAAAMSTNCWYAWYALTNSSGAVDFGFDLAFPPTVPTTTASWPYYRYIGGRKTSTSTAWAPYVQHGDAVRYAASTSPNLDMSVAASTGARGVHFMNVPPQVVEWIGSVNISNMSGVLNEALILTDLNTLDLQPTVGGVATIFAGGTPGATTSAGGECRCWTNSSGAIGVRDSLGRTILIQTLGWVDPRGKPV